MLFRSGETAVEVVLAESGSLPRGRGRPFEADRHCFGVAVAAVVFAAVLDVDVARRPFLGAGWWPGCLYHGGVHWFKGVVHGVVDYDGFGSHSSREWVADCRASRTCNGILVR